MINKRVLIIAEAGVNHNGSLDLAKSLVDAAASAGADLVKFQTFKTSRFVTQSAKKAEYQIRSFEPKNSQFEMLQSLELTAYMHNQLIEHCKRKGIGFFSTAFDIESLEYLESLGFERFKIPSGEITNFPYLRHVGRLNKEIILSTGMSTMGDIEAALDVLESSGTPKEKITVLHCTTEYPTPMSEVNLRAMKSIRKAFGVSVGYSDHTLGIEVPIAAVALGAAVIEKHLTLDRAMPGPDHKASLLPSEFSEMTTAIRNIEQALGTGVKRVSQCEIKNMEAARKTIVAAFAIKKGEIFTEENLAVKRASNGMSPMRWCDVVGKVASRNYEIDELIVL